MAKKIKRARKSLFKPRSDTLDLLPQALALHQAGDLNSAAIFYKRILKQEPKNGDALNLSGALAVQQGNPAQALKYLRRAVKFYPERHDYQVNMAAALRDLGESVSASIVLKKIIRQAPQHHEALHNLAAILADLRDYQQAAEYYRRFIALRPRNIEALSGLIGVLRRNNQLIEALGLCERLLALSPDSPHAHTLKADILIDMEHHEEALKVFKEAVKQKPDNGILYNNMANILLNMGRLHEALSLYELAVVKSPEINEAWVNLAWTYREHGQLPESWRCFKHLLAARKMSAADYSDLLFSLNYDPEIPPQKKFELAQGWWNNCSLPLPPRPLPAAPPTVDTPLRLGFISPDFRNHPVGQFILPLLKILNPDKIETFCYASLNKPADEQTTKLREAARHWRDIYALSDEQAATLIRQDHLHLLIELTGHTSGNRLLVMVRRPAPIQASWLGYVATSGLPMIDYRLTDAICDPPGADKFYSECLYRLPHTFFCYSPPAEAPPLTTPPMIKNKGPTFASFNNLPKITPAVTALWAQILNRLPEARLVMVSRQFVDSAIIRRYQELFLAHNIAGERLVFQAGLPFKEYLALFNQVDIALDPFPHNGHTITCDTLWMGVPVITITGNCYAGRMGCSIMKHAGLSNMIAVNEDEYVEKAVRLGRDKDDLTALRAGMRQRLLSSKICDIEQFGHDFTEAAYNMVHQYEQLK
ncbi:tetratricopeptide repeat protein [Desulfobacterota bacterium M19]